MNQMKEETLEEIVRIMGPHMQRVYADMKDRTFESRLERQESLGALNALQEVAEFILDRPL